MGFSPHLLAPPLMQYDLLTQTSLVLVPEINKCLILILFLNLYECIHNYLSNHIRSGSMNGNVCHSACFVFNAGHQVIASHQIRNGVKYYPSHLLRDIFALMAKN